MFKEFADALSLPAVCESNLRPEILGKCSGTELHPKSKGQGGGEAKI